MRQFAHGIYQDIKASPMGHANNDFLGAGFSTFLDYFIQQRDEAISALQ